jgi:hypothetical protein
MMFFWMLPFSSKEQAQIIRQKNQVTDEEWQKHCDLITAEHRLPAAREQLEQHWKAWISQDALKAAVRRQPVLRPRLRRFRNTTHSSLLPLPPASQHEKPPIDTLDVLAKRCCSWRQGTKFKSVFSEMQNEFRRIQTKFRRT